MNMAHMTDDRIREIAEDANEDWLADEAESISLPDLIERAIRLALSEQDQSKGAVNMDLREIAEELDYRLFGETRTNYRHDLIMFALRSVAPRWVPVGEGLPENLSDVLVHSTDFGVGIGYSVPGPGWRRINDGDGQIAMRINVTHWMPLPPPPEVCK